MYNTKATHSLIPHVQHRISCYACLIPLATSLFSPPTRENTSSAKIQTILHFNFFRTWCIFAEKSSWLCFRRLPIRKSKWFIQSYTPIVLFSPCSTSLCWSGREQHNRTPHRYVECRKGISKKPAKEMKHVKKEKNDYSWTLFAVFLHKCVTLQIILASGC